MRSLLLFALGTALTLLPQSEIEAQRRCTKGIPCGKTCIAANRTCRTGSPPSRPTTSPTPRPAAAAPPSSIPAEASPSNAGSARTTAGSSQPTGLTVPGVPGYVALDSTELIEVQAARLRALERARQGRPFATLPASPSDSMGRGAEASLSGGTAASATGPWVASRRGAVYYKTGCRGANNLVVQNRIYFQSEKEAQAAGYRRSTASGC